jgi:Rrf2 family iron-sulfur cluster assembly transcriptional regulator
MNITSKSRYALKIMMDLTQHEGELVHRSDVAHRQGVPLDYMDQILSRLRDAGLIESTRGRGGGYKLARQPDQISILEIFSNVEDVFEPVQCLDGGLGCLAQQVCQSKDAWGVISGAIHQALSGIILADIVASTTSGKGASLDLPAAPQECRAPRRKPSATKF